MAENLNDIQPVVLVGGESKRFGRDKLLEPVGQGLLVDHPIMTLRAVFGHRVALIGDCDPRISSRADLIIPDQHPGTGPIGGIVSGLVHCQCAVLVLAGDLCSIEPSSVKLLIQSARDDSAADAIVAKTDRLEPCVGMYRLSALDHLAFALNQKSCRLYEVLNKMNTRCVPIDAARLRNINHQQDLDCQ